jgi:hypothetical protein
MGLEVEKGSEMIVRRGPGGGAGKGGGWLKRGGW